MATFLELAQEVARQSGTMSGIAPTNVAGQTGRLLLVVNWTRDAWIDIQNRHSSWFFLRRDFQGDTTPGTGKYTATSWNIDHFAEWIVDTDGAPGAITLFRHAEGPADETPLRLIDYTTYRNRYERGVQAPNRPGDYAINPAGALCLGPVPDDQYTIRGEYRQAPQVMTANDDEPICPPRFHGVIMHRALELLAQHDEAPPTRIATDRAEFLNALGDLERDQLPRPFWGAAPIA